MWKGQVFPNTVTYVDASTYVLHIRICDRFWYLFSFYIKIQGVCSYSLVAHVVIHSYPRITSGQLKKMWNQKGLPRPLVVDGIQIMARPQSIERQRTMFCRLVIIRIPSTTGGLGCPFWFHIFISQAFFSSWLLLFYLELYQIW